MSISAVAVAALAAFATSCARGTAVPPTVGSSFTIAAPNDNRVPAGSLRDGVLRLDLDAVWAGWRPDADVDTAATVQAFAERGTLPTIPGPLVRIPEGTEVRLTVRNLILDSTLIVHGLRAGAVADDSFSVAPGATREIVFTAANAGTFHYWGTTSHSALNRRVGRDALLSGAIVVDPAGTVPDPRERVFVITLIDYMSDTALPPPREAIWEIAVNGSSWPHTERLSYAMGDTARWRFINATDRPHPMHLHGFHFLVTSKGDGKADTTYSPDTRRHAVTEFMVPGSTFSLEWILTRPGNWLVHCHMIPHMTPYPMRPDSTRLHDVHAVEQHPTVSMAGLVLGVSVTDPRGRYAAPVAQPVATHRLFLQESRPQPGIVPRKGFVLQREAEPALDSVEVPGSPLVVVRGQRNSITIVNRMRTASSVHWHGMELESLFDGVAGFSGVGSARAPLIAPGDSFTVWFTPPRAGTYIYHSHMDEEDQLFSGMYAPLLVLEPGERHDPSTDLTMVVGMVPAIGGGFAYALNGTVSPNPIRVQAGKTYRLRLINILFAPAITVELSAADSAVQRWRLISKDGATVPEAFTAVRPARMRIGVGETYDLRWVAPAGESLLKIQPGARPGEAPLPPLLQKLISRP
ncbi:MAG: multicopper oxidase domain-containing protein [Gemmatimonadaceae bacterium]|nr:multicopper oxidase domain-containing protein [Gemmatimonadaceae bacterium]